MNNLKSPKPLSMSIAQRKNAMSNVKLERFQHSFGQTERKYQKVLISVKEEPIGFHEQAKSHVLNSPFSNKIS